MRRRTRGYKDDRAMKLAVALAVTLFIVVAGADSITISVDFTDPNATVISVDESSAFSFAAQNGTNWTVWYNNASAGSFSVTANAQDNVSGIVNMTWPVIFGAGGTNYTANISDINFTWTYSWATSDTADYTDQYVTVYDNASNYNTSSNFFNVVLDNVAPATTDDGPLDNITVYNNTPSLTINFTATDNVGGSGVNATYYCSYVASNPPCTPTTAGNAVTLTCSGICSYFIRYYSADQVGNNEDVKSSNLINMTTVYDVTSPFIYLVSPLNDTYVPSGNVTFVYVVSDQGSNIADCKLYINGALNATNATSVVNGGENNFTIEMNEADYNWTVGCTDTSIYGPNSGNATQRFVRVDGTLPLITAFAITYPANQTEVKNVQSVVIDVNVSDTRSGVSNVTLNCTPLGSGFVYASLFSGTSADGTWRGTCLVSGPVDFEGDVNISAIALDGVGLSSTNETTIAVDNLVPENPSYLNVTAWPVDGDGIVNLSWPVSISADVVSYNVYRSNASGFTPAPALFIGSTNVTSFLDVPFADGTWYWQITAIDNVGHENTTAAPENYTLVDTGAPTILNLTLAYPTISTLTCGLSSVSVNITQTHVKNGDALLITVNVTDPQNVSVVWVDVSAINTSIGNATMLDDGSGGDAVASDGIFTYNATIGGTVGDSNQTIRIYANDTSGNVRNGVSAVVAIDGNVPTSLIAQDDGNYTATTTSIHANWSYVDYSALGYAYTIYDNSGNTSVNLTFTTLTDVTQAVVPPMTENSTYYWHVCAYDGAGHSADNYTDGITVDTTAPTFVYVSDTGTLTNSTTQLNATWLANDDQSGVRKYYYRIGEDSNSDGVVEQFFVYNTTDGVWRFGSITSTTLQFSDVATNTSANATIENLTTNFKYYFEVKAENWAGISSFGRSDGIIVGGYSTPNVSLTLTPSSSYISTSTVTFAPTCSDLVLGISECKTYVRYNSGAWALVSTTQGAQTYSMASDGLYDFVTNATNTGNITSTSAIVWVGRTTTVTTPAPSGGGGGGVTVTPPPVYEIQNISEIGEDMCGTLDYSHYAEHAVKSIEICVSKSVSNISLQVMIKDTVSRSSPGIAYKYIEVTDLGGKLTGSIVNVTYTLAVPTYWAEQNSVAFYRVKLYRYEYGEWATLNTEWLSSGGTYHYYRTISPGLSTLSVAGPLMNAQCPTCPAPSTYTECANGYETRTEYSCGVATANDCIPHLTSKSCVPSTMCPICSNPSEWTVCADGVQTRTEYACGSTTQYICEPKLAARECEMAAACPTCPEPLLWSECTDNVRYRSAYRCGPETNYACIRVDETSSCMPFEGLLIIIVVILLLAGLVIATARRRRLESWLQRVTRSETTVPTIRMPTPTKSARPERRVVPTKPSAFGQWARRAGQAEMNVPEVRMPSVPAKPSAFSRWTRRVGESDMTVPKIRMPAPPEQPTAFSRWTRRVGESDTTVPNIRAPTIVARAKPGIFGKWTRRIGESDTTVPNIRMPVKPVAAGPTSFDKWRGRVGQAEMEVPRIRMPAKPAAAGPTSFDKWRGRVGRSGTEIPTIPQSPVRRPMMAEMPAALPAVTSRLRVPGKPKYVCSVCGRPELLIHWCEECGQEVCIQHIHKVGTRLMCNNCMKRKGM